MTHPCTSAGHGGTTVLPEPFATDITLADCKKACQADSECTAVVVPDAGA